MGSLQQRRHLMWSISNDNTTISLHRLPIDLAYTGCFGVIVGFVRYRAGRTVNLDGNLIGDSPCTVNNNQLITVDFEDVQIKDVRGREGSEYERPVPFSIQCDNANTNDSMNLKLSGTLAWDGYMLQTSQPQLGLNFYVNGQLVRVNEDIDFLYGNPPDITVAPEGSSALSMNDAGVFTATASLMVEYQ